jgi:predicted nuclease with TOPRIM domain
MKDERNIYRKLFMKITINLAQQQELRYQNEMLQNHCKLIETKIDKLIKELKALTDENSDLKEMVFSLNKENEQLRKRN